MIPHNEWVPEYQELRYFAARLQLHEVLREVVTAIIANNPNFSSATEVWAALNQNIEVRHREWNRDEVSFDWVVAIDSDGVAWINCLGISTGGEPFTDYDPWYHTRDDPSRDFLMLDISFDDLLDFNQNGLVDPSEYLWWDGRLGGSLPWGGSVLFRPSPPAGLELNGGTSWLKGYARVPILRIGTSLPNILSIDRNSPDALNLSMICPASDNPTAWNWGYMLMQSESLENPTWQRLSWFQGNDQVESVVQPGPVPGAPEFFRLKQYNNNHFRPWDLSPSDNAQVDSQDVLLRWKDGGEAVVYTIYFSDDSIVDESDIIGVIESENTPLPSEFEVRNLIYNTTYWWQVLARLPSGIEFESAVERLRSPDFPFTLSTQLLRYDEASRTVDVTLAADEEWHVETLPDWIGLSHTTGTGGSTTISLTIQENTSSEERTGVITFTGPTAEISLTVLQLGHVTQILLEEDWESGVVDPAKWSVTFDPIHAETLPGLRANQFSQGTWSFSPGDGTKLQWPPVGIILQSVDSFTPQPGMEVRFDFRFGSGMFNGMHEQWIITLSDLNPETLDPGLDVFIPHTLYDPTGNQVLYGSWDFTAIRILSDGSVAYIDNGKVIHQTASGWIDLGNPAERHLEIYGVSDSNEAGAWVDGLLIRVP